MDYKTSDFGQYPQIDVPGSYAETHKPDINRLRRTGVLKGQGATPSRLTGPT